MARILNTDNIQSTYFGGGRLYSVKYADGILENGYIGIVGELEKNENEIRKFSKVTDITEAKELVLIGTPEIIYDNKPSMRRLENFVIEQGDTARAFSLHVGDEFGLSLDAFANLNGTYTEDLNKYVILKNNDFQLEVKDTSMPSSGEKFVCRIEGFYTMNRPFQLSKFEKKPNETVIARLKIIKYENQ